jgi:hypothetical protein
MGFDGTVNVEKPVSRREVLQNQELSSVILSLPETVQSSHFETTDFRVANKIFASLPEPDRLVLKLTREQQEMVVDSDGAIFSPLANKWGEKGWTNARVDALDAASALSVLWMAWENVASKTLRLAAGRG